MLKNWGVKTDNLMGYSRQTFMKEFKNIYCYGGQTLNASKWFEIEKNNQILAEKVIHFGLCDIFFFLLDVSSVLATAKSFSVVKWNFLWNYESRRQTQWLILNRTQA